MEVARTLVLRDLNGGELLRGFEVRQEMASCGLPL
jgi:hypothetical protein